MDSFFTLMIPEISIQTLRVFADRKTLDMSDFTQLYLSLKFQGDVFKGNYSKDLKNLINQAK